MVDLRSRISVKRIAVGLALAGGFSFLFATGQELLLTCILLGGVGADLVYLWYCVWSQTLQLLPATILTAYAIASCYAIYILYYSSIWITYGICATVSLSDICQYFVGKYGGYIKVNSFSPKKTGEGYLGGGMLTVILTSPFYSPRMTIPWVMLGILGDLWVSILKRWLQVKDISNLLGDHGGWIDRLDGIFLASLGWD